MAKFNSCSCFIINVRTCMFSLGTCAEFFFLPHLRGEQLILISTVDLVSLIYVSSLVTLDQ